MAVLPVPLPDICFYLFQSHARILFRHFFETAERSRVNGCRKKYFYIRMRKHCRPNIPSVQNNPAFCSLAPLYPYHGGADARQSRNRRHPRRNLRRADMIRYIMSVDNHMHGVGFRFHCHIHSCRQRDDIFFFCQFPPKNFVSHRTVHSTGIQVSVPHICRQNFGNTALSCPRRSVNRNS